ncbi:hypothetical protein G6F59_016287 [Rhizopus arrhizus]|nr:hypothetical protein G6F59_016287 [Rhizopus arrhizus]
MGREAWQQRFNILLSGSVNLQRDPRNGRNFEYAGEDPLLAGSMVALRAERHGDPPQLPRRAHRRAGHARVGPARLRDRAGGRPPGRGDVFVQQDQWHLRLRERLPDEPGAEAGMEVPRFRDVRLGWRAQWLEGGAGRPGPAVGR